MNRAGFVLIEVTIAYIILALAIAALVPVFMIALKAGKNSEQLQVATYLSTELLEEIRMRKWDERTLSTTFAHIPAPSSVLGTDTGETATDKRTFDDVDDFNGWSEAQAVDPIMRALPDFTAYRRTAAVAYVDSTMSVVGFTTDYKMITVCTRTAKISPTCMSSLVTNR